MEGGERERQKDVEKGRETKREKTVVSGDQTHWKHMVQSHTGPVRGLRPLLGTGLSGYFGVAFSPQ